MKVSQCLVISVFDTGRYFIFPLFLQCYALTYGCWFLNCSVQSVVWPPPPTGRKWIHNVPLWVGGSGLQDKVNSRCSCPGGGGLGRATERGGGPWKSRLWALKWQCEKLLYVKLSMSLFFIGLGLMILMQANPFTWPLEGVGPCKVFARIKIITSRAIQVHYNY